MTPRERRVAPPCAHFGTCGGCTLLDRSIDEQLDRKVAAVADAVAPWIAARDVAFDPPERVPRGFRTRLLWPARELGGRLRLGLYAQGSHDLVAIERCQVQDPALTRLAHLAESTLQDLGLSAHDSDRGDVRAFQARLAPGTREVLAGIVTRGGLLPEARAFAERLRARARGLRDRNGALVRLIGVVRNLNDAPGNVLLGPRTVPLSGRDHLVDRADGLRFRISFGSFYQVHRGAPALLYRPALALLGDVTGARIVDGYGGVGTFGLRLAARGAREVEIVESHEAACRDAEVAAQWNGLADRVTVRRAAFAEADLRPADVCVVDPPRAGLGAPGVEAVIRTRAQRVLHVACSLAALRRDVEGLVAAGYRLVAVRLADLFPHTEHVEVVCLLVRGLPGRTT